MVTHTQLTHTRNVWHENPQVHNHFHLKHMHFQVKHVSFTRKLFIMHVKTHAIPVIVSQKNYIAFHLRWNLVSRYWFRSDLVASREIQSRSIWFARKRCRLKNIVKMLVFHLKLRPHSREWILAWDVEFSEWEVVFGSFGFFRVVLFLQNKLQLGCLRFW